MAKAVTFIIYGAASVLALIFLYQAFVVRSHYLDRFKTYGERKAFLEAVPQPVRGFVFIAPLVHESERIVDQGLLMPTVLQWVEQSFWFKAITLDSWYSRLSLLVILCFVAYLVFQYATNVKYVEVMADKALQRNEILQGGKRRVKREVAAVAQQQQQQAPITKEQIQQAMLLRLQERAAVKQQHFQFQDAMDNTSPEQLAALMLAPQAGQS